MLPNQFTIADLRRQGNASGGSPDAEPTGGRTSALVRAKKKIHYAQPGAMAFNNQPSRDPMDIHRALPQYNQPNQSVLD
jgi:hypothetical protein